MEERIKYNYLTIEAAVSGWIVKQQGKPTEVFTQWEEVIKRLERELTNKGNADSTTSGCY